MNNENICPKCGSQLSEVTTTATGKMLQRCSQGSWNSQTKQAEGCDYVKWINTVELEESCPKCGGKIILQTTRSGKKMKKCQNGGWDSVNKKATGCDYIEWINGTQEQLEETCPKCGQALVLYTTANGKKMKKCSTSGWDKSAKKATGCDYVLWLNSNNKNSDTGEEYLPPEPEDLPF